MKKEDLTVLVAVAIVAAAFSLILSSMLFKSKGQSLQVPVVENLSSTLPDPYNDPTYKAIFNSKAIDPAQSTEIGNQKNNSPFTGSVSN